MCIRDSVNAETAGECRTACIADENAQPYACGLEATCEDAKTCALPPIQVCEEEPLFDDPYTIKSAPFVQGDRIDFELEYGGGCQDHEFVLCWNGDFVGQPPSAQAEIRLYHNANGDLCRALITEIRSYNLAPMRRAYNAQFQSRTGTVDLIPYLFRGVVPYSF